MVSLSNHEAESRLLVQSPFGGRVVTQEKVDKRFVQESWEVPDHVSAYAKWAREIGLWDSERLLVSRYLSKTDRILDIGCGAGRMTIGLYRLGYTNIQGVDLSTGMIEEARSLVEEVGFAIPFDVGDATDLQYGGSSFDGALFCGQAFTSIPGRDIRLRALAEVHRVLRPGGHFIFTTHDRDAVREFADFWREEKLRWENGSQDTRLLEFGDRIIEDHGTSTFIHIPTRDEVMEMVQQAGLVLVEDSMRSELSSVRESSADCRMWVVRRPEGCAYCVSLCDDRTRPKSRVEDRAAGAPASQAGGRR